MRSRSLRRLIRVSLVFALCLCLTVDPAQACHWVSRCWGGPSYQYYRPAPVCVPMYQPVYQPCNPCGSYVVVESPCHVDPCDCVSGEVVESEGTVTEGPVTGEMPSEAAGGSTWSSSSPATDRAVNKPADEAAPIEEAPALAEEEPITPPPVAPPVEEPAVVAPPVEEPAVVAPVEETPAVVEPAMEQPATDPATDDLFAPAEEVPATETPATEEPAADDLFGGEPATEAPADVAPATEEPAADDLFGGEPATEAPMEEAPATETPATDDLFGPGTEAPATETPTTEEPAADDLFGGEPATEAPADVAPATEEPAADDLFGGEPATEAPMEEAPATETPAADDLFGPGTEAPATETPATEEPADDLFGPGAEAPATEEPAADDLFGGEPAADAPMENAVDSEAPAADDLFGGESVEEAPMEDPAAGNLDESLAEEEENVNDLFGPAADAQEGAPNPDDLFGGEPAAEAPATEAPVAEEAEEGMFSPTEDTGTPETDDADDLFGPSSVLEQPGGFDSLALRHWVDSTGTYTVDARLVAVTDGSVKLLKANGRTTTVPFSRLSSEDLEFVNAQASARAAQDISRTAQR